MRHLHPLQIDDAVISKYVEKRRSIFLAKNGRNPSESTIYMDVNLIQSILNHAYAKNMISKPIKLKKPRRAEPRDRWLDKKEIKKLTAGCRQTPHLYVAVILLLSTAGRVRAILDLKWESLDFGRRTIDLRVGEKQHSKRRAIVPMNDGRYEMLMDWRQHCDSPWVVEYRGGKVNSIYNAFRKAAERAGLEKVHPHVLRHTVAVHMIVNGSPMAKVSQYLGHSSIKVTEEVYARFAPQHLHQEAASVDFLSN